MVQLQLHNCLHLLRRCPWDCQCLDSGCNCLLGSPRLCGGLSWAVIWWSVQGYSSDFRKLGQALFGWQLGEHVWKGQKPIPQIKITLQSSPILKSKVGFSYDCFLPMPLLFEQLLCIHVVWAYVDTTQNLCLLFSIWVHYAPQINLIMQCPLIKGFACCITN
jgi:hypothetical protein